MIDIHSSLAISSILRDTAVSVVSSQALWSATPPKYARLPLPYPLRSRGPRQRHGSRPPDRRVVYPPCYRLDLLGNRSALASEGGLSNLKSCRLDDPAIRRNVVTGLDDAGHQSLCQYLYHL